MIVPCFMANATGLEMGFERFIDEVFCKAVDLAGLEVVLLQQVPKGQNRLEPFLG